MFVAGQIELPYVITLWLFIILARKISKKKKHILHISMLRYALRNGLQILIPINGKNIYLIKFLCLDSE